MLYKYSKFLENLDFILSDYFKQQDNYIFCKAGCCDCCKLGQYPMSAIEFDYVEKALVSLPKNTKNIVTKRINKLKKEYEKHINKNKSKNFEHACPFLVNNLCCIYENRPIICRTFGLIKSAKMQDGTVVALLPECINQGLNYSNVFNFETNDFDNDKIKQLNNAIQPMTYDISLQTIYEKNKKNIDFSNKKTMIEFLKDL